MLVNAAIVTNACAAKAVNKADLHFRGKFSAIRRGLLVRFSYTAPLCIISEKNGAGRVSEHVLAPKLCVGVEDTQASRLSNMCLIHTVLPIPSSVQKPSQTMKSSNRLSFTETALRSVNE